MNEQEGVIKYRLEHRECDLAADLDIRQINAWRSLLFQLRLIGQAPGRYQGLGYGNISQRLQADKPGFLISGTQTGHLPCLQRNHFAIVEEALPLQNHIRSSGPCKPSSEALTHASVYLNDINTQTVIHVHCPTLWRHTLNLKLPHTAADIAYGSVAMATAVEKLFSSGELARLPLFSMLGHEDGIVVFGASPAEAASTLLTQLANALAIEQSNDAG